MEVTQIYPARHADNGVFTVRYSGLVGDGRFEVHAADELDAFKRATHKLKEREVNERYFIVALTISVLALLASLTYACSTPSFRETCIASGKRYVDATIASQEKPDVEACY